MSSPDVTFVSLANPNVAGEVTVGNAPLGEDGPRPGLHAPLFATPAGDEVLVPDPAGGRLHRIHVMAGHPMEMDQTRVDPGSDFVVPLPTGLREVGPGVYQRVARFDRPGTYTLRLELGPDRSPFEFALEAVNARPEKPWMIELVPPAEPAAAGRQTSVAFRITSRQTGAARDGVRDGVITVSRFAPGEKPWQQVVPAEPAGDGIYRARVVFPTEGTFTASFGSWQLGLTPTDTPNTSVGVSPSPSPGLAPPT